VPPGLEGGCTRRITRGGLLFASTAPGVPPAGRGEARGCSGAPRGSGSAAAGPGPRARAAVLGHAALGRERELRGSRPRVVRAPTGGTGARSMCRSAISRVREGPWPSICCSCWCVTRDRPLSFLALPTARAGTCASSASCDVASSCQSAGLGPVERDPRWAPIIRGLCAPPMSRNRPFRPWSSHRGRRRALGPGQSQRDQMISFTTWPDPPGAGIVLRTSSPSRKVIARGWVVPDQFGKRLSSMRWTTVSSSRSYVPA
jgi:hypothetical protein